MTSLLNSLEICVTILAFPCQRAVLVFHLECVQIILFRNGLDHRLGLCREVIERAEYHLNLGYITPCIYIYSSVRLPAASK